MKKAAIHRLVLVGFIVGALSACGTVPERNPVPEEFAETASIPGIPEARVWADTVPKNLDERVELFKDMFAKSRPEWVKSPTFLAISGGGQNGAFGAGLLVGWTAAGTRPEFMAVTGISTGALIAPFAFMGSAYDEKLEMVYTSTSTKDIINKRSLLAGATSDALADTEPLKALIAEYFDQEFLDGFVKECRRGRSLLIATTNLDSARPVEWRLCDIAMSGQPNSLALMHQIILASTSIPGAFPPVIIEVETEDGRRFDELHVDGGATAQIFLYSNNLDLRKVLDEWGVEGSPSVYVIRNSQRRPQWKATEASLGSIVGRSINSIIKYQGMGDIYRMYLGAKKDGLDFNAAFIPESFDASPEEPFDPVYMQALFELGHRLAVDGYPWLKTPDELAPAAQY
jgi:hypothetical protein